MDAAKFTFHHYLSRREDWVMLLLECVTHVLFLLQIFRTGNHFEQRFSTTHVSTDQKLRFTFKSTRIRYLLILRRRRVLDDAIIAVAGVAGVAGVVHHHFLQLDVLVAVSRCRRRDSK